MISAVPSGAAIAGGVCATVTVPPGETREVVFSLAWDMPLARAGGGRAHYRRYTRFYGRKGDAAPAIARDALLNYPAWEKAIEAWQAGCSDYYRAPNGRIVTQWPRSMPALEQALSGLDETCYAAAVRVRK